MQIKLVSLEDAITSCGFRKMAAFVSGINADTEACYVSTDRYLTVRSAITGKMGAKSEMGAEQTDEIARSLVGADLVGFSSMSHYADLYHQVSARLRELSPDTYQVWGGIHPIIHPEDAITADVMPSASARASSPARSCTACWRRVGTSPACGTSGSRPTVASATPTGM